MWQQELLGMFDKNHDRHVSLYELILGCVPDTDNDGKITPLEFGYGRKTAVQWLANILASVPLALSDGCIDLGELKKSSTSNVSPTAEILAQAEKLLQQIQLE